MGAGFQVPAGLRRHTFPLGRTGVDPELTIPKSADSSGGISSLLRAAVAPSSRSTPARISSQTPAASVLSLPVGYECFLLFPGFSQTTEMQAMVKQLHGALGANL